MLSRTHSTNLLRRCVFLLRSSISIIARQTIKPKLCEVTVWIALERCECHEWTPRCINEAARSSRVAKPLQRTPREHLKAVLVWRAVHLGYHSNVKDHEGPILQNHRTISGFAGLVSAPVLTGLHLEQTSPVRLTGDPFRGSTWLWRKVDTNGRAMLESIRKDGHFRYSQDSKKMSTSHWSPRGATATGVNRLKE